MGELGFVSVLTPGHDHDHDHNHNHDIDEVAAYLVYLADGGAVSAATCCALTL